MKLKKRSLLNDKHLGKKIIAFVRKGMISKSPDKDISGEMIQKNKTKLIKVLEKGYFDDIPSFCLLYPGNYKQVIYQRNRNIRRAPVAYIDPIYVKNPLLKEYFDIVKILSTLLTEELSKNGIIWDDKNQEGFVYYKKLSLKATIIEMLLKEIYKVINRDIKVIGKCEHPKRCKECNKIFDGEVTVFPVKREFAHKTISKKYEYASEKKKYCSRPCRELYHSRISNFKKMLAHPDYWKKKSRLTRPAKNV